MIGYFKVGILLFFLNVDISGEYYRHIQVCSGVNAIDRKWQLSIKPDRTFLFSIKSINTNLFDKVSVEKVYGVWLLINDTLMLYGSNEKKEFMFLVRSNKLVPVASRRIEANGLMINPDYLEKSETVELTQKVGTSKK